MPAPSPLSISTSSLLRLVKEERSYHHELQQQESQVEKLQSQSGEEGDENAAWRLGQEKRAIEETKAIFPGLRARIREAVGRLEGLLESDRGGNTEEMAKAEEALAKAETSQREMA